VATKSGAASPTRAANAAALASKIIAAAALAAALKLRVPRNRLDFMFMCFSFLYGVTAASTR
jgi:hypothetical protein